MRSSCSGMRSVATILEDMSSAPSTDDRTVPVRHDGDRSVAAHPGGPMDRSLARWAFGRGPVPDPGRPVGAPRERRLGALSVVRPVRFRARDRGCRGEPRGDRKHHDVSATRASSPSWSLGSAGSGRPWMIIRWSSPGAWPDRATSCWRSPRERSFAALDAAMADPDSVRRRPRPERSGGIDPEVRGARGSALERRREEAPI